MTFAGSYSAALSFSLSGTPALGAETKSLALAASQTLDNGSAANQGTLGWGNLVVIPAGQTYQVDLQAAAGDVLGIGGVFTFTTVRGVYVENQQTVAANNVLVGIAGGNDTNGYAVNLEGGGTFLWTAPLGGRPITSANRYLTISNPNAVSVAVALGVFGLGTIQD